MADKSLTTSLLEFAIETRTQDIPEELFDWASLRLIDTVGAALVSASFGCGHSALLTVIEEDAPGDATLWASAGRTTHAANAAFANGTLAHGMDYDDTHTEATLHPGVVIVPTALAVAEEEGSSGVDVLAAVSIGYEVMARLGRVYPGRFQHSGFHATSVLGIIGAVAVTARLRGADIETSVNAAGIAGSMASGLMAYLSDGSDTKTFHPGWAAKGAITALSLARNGLEGPALVLEGPSGLFSSFIREDLDPAEVVLGLGSEWVGTRVSTKPYPACHCVHAPADAFIALRERLDLSTEDVMGIQSVTGLVPDFYRILVCDPLEEKQKPRTEYEARFSLPFAVGKAMVDGRLTAGSFEEDQLDDPQVLEMSSRVDYEVVEYAEYPECFPGGVRVVLRDGSVHEEHLRHNIGSVQNPMTRAAVHDKFLEGATRVAGTQDATELLSCLEGFARQESTEGFSAAMSRTTTNLESAGN
jgi:2-methylcitrate dehydratase PrpD